MTNIAGSSNRETSNIHAQNYNLPLPPTDVAGQKEEMAIYARFMRHLRHVPNSRMEIKILSAIQFTADMLDHSDAQVAKILVEQGLRAPRLSFPADYLSFIDQSLARSSMELGGPSEDMKELRAFWDNIGEDKFGAIKSGYDLLEPYVTTAV